MVGLLSKGEREPDQSWELLQIVSKFASFCDDLTIKMNIVNTIIAYIRAEPDRPIIQKPPLVTVLI